MSASSQKLHGFWVEVEFQPQAVSFQTCYTQCVVLNIPCTKSLHSSLLLPQLQVGLVCGHMNQCHYLIIYPLCYYPTPIFISSFSTPPPHSLRPLFIPRLPFVCGMIYLEFQNKQTPLGLYITYSIKVKTYTYNEKRTPRKKNTIPEKNKQKKTTTYMIYCKAPGSLAGGTAHKIIISLLQFRRSYLPRTDFSISIRD